MKIYGHESPNGDVPCAKLENAIEGKKFAPIFFPDYVKTRNLYWLRCLTLPLYQIWWLAWKMSSGMPKEVGSLNGPLCTYLMRQNLHDQTPLKSKGNKCPCQVWKWSVKNYGHETSVPLFSCFLSIVKSHISYSISRLYLAGVATALLRWHLSNMDVIFARSKILLMEKLTNPHPWIPYPSVR